MTQRASRGGLQKPREKGHPTGGRKVEGRRRIAGVETDAQDSRTPRHRRFLPGAAVPSTLALSATGRSPKPSMAEDYWTIGSTGIMNIRVSEDDAGHRRGERLISRS